MAGSGAGRAGAFALAGSGGGSTGPPASATWRSNNSSGWGPLEPLGSVLRSDERRPLRPVPRRDATVAAWLSPAVGRAATVASLRGTGGRVVRVRRQQGGAFRGGGRQRHGGVARKRKGARKRKSRLKTRAALFGGCGRGAQ